MPGLVLGKQAQASFSKFSMHEGHQENISGAELVKKEYAQLMD